MVTSLLSMDNVEEELKLIKKDFRNLSDSGFFNSDDETNEDEQKDSINGNLEKILWKK